MGIIIFIATVVILCLVTLYEYIAALINFLPLDVVVRPNQIRDIAHLMLGGYVFLLAVWFLTDSVILSLLSFASVILFFNGHTWPALVMFMIIMFRGADSKSKRRR